MNTSKANTKIQCHHFSIHIVYADLLSKLPPPPKGTFAALLVGAHRNKGGSTRRSRVQPGKVWLHIRPQYATAEEMCERHTGCSAENTPHVSSTCVHL